MRTRYWTYLLISCSGCSFCSRNGRLFIQLCISRVCICWNVRFLFNCGRGYYHGLLISFKLLGNMSNPCINRWGLNTFWHNYWYSDSRYALFLGQDKIFTDLVQLYLIYGTAYSSTFFRHTFWYKSSTTPPSLQLETYYRWVTTRGREAHEVATARLRLTTAEMFQTRVSILRLNSWFIINIYWFQPDKLKNKRAKRSRTSHTITPLRAANSSMAPFFRVNTLFRASTLLTESHTPSYHF